MKLVPHGKIPLIGEWCTVCRAFTQHQNGYVISSNPLTAKEPRQHRAATICTACNWPRTYR